MAKDLKDYIIVTSKNKNFRLKIVIKQEAVRKEQPFLYFYRLILSVGGVSIAHV
jgi:hypothetical protein